MKSHDLQIRPVYHWREPRVRAHLFLCMLAYHVEWHLRQRLCQTKILALFLTTQ